MSNGLVPDVFEEVACVVDGVRPRLAPGPTSSQQDVRTAMRLLDQVSNELAAMVAEQLSQQSPQASELLAVRERFDSHLLAASLLEDSQVSATSALAVLRKGLERLAGDLRACRRELVHAGR
jgi:hypothetical protein